MRGKGFVHSWLEKLRPIVVAQPGSWQQRHREYLLGAQNADGGFAGRRGPSCPYYTSFGLRGLFLLDAVSQSVRERSLQFFRSIDWRKLAPADVVAVIFSSLVVNESLLEKSIAASYFRTLLRNDGGFASTRESPVGSVYSTFLVVEACTILSLATDSRVGPFREERPLICDQEITNFLSRHQKQDGGFTENPVIPSGSTPVTAAALAALRLLGTGEECLVKPACEFLAQMQDRSGGFRAWPASPVPDLLSTAVSLLVLAEWRVLSLPQVEAVQNFVSACERPGGGYSGHIDDPQPDVEYTFYGLVAQALIKWHKQAH